MAVCIVFSCHFLHSRKKISVELCFLRCHIEVNKHVSVEEFTIFSYKFARAVLSQIEENKIIQMEVRFEDCDNPCLEVKKCGFQWGWA